MPTKIYNNYAVHLFSIDQTRFGHILMFVTGALSLRDVKLILPSAVEKGQRAVLRCLYNMEGDALYTVKWYKGEREFFRYVPKDIPPTKQFPINGLLVLGAESNATQVVLGDVRFENAGKYNCEISADAPSFFTQFKIGFLKVRISVCGTTDKLKLSIFVLAVSN